MTPATLAVLLPETCHPSFGLCFLPYDKRGPRQQRLLQGCRDRGGGTRGPCDPGSARWPRPDPMAPPPRGGPAAHLLWVSQSTQWEFPRTFRMDCRAIASLWLVSRDWTHGETHRGET